jgi:hypothetical protein
MKKILTAIALATLLATPAFAATRHQTAHTQLQQSSPRLFMYAPGGISNPGRDAALHECSVLASQLSNSAWQTAQFAQYGTCMAEHGQQP